jgi:hypothetical protein
MLGTQVHADVLLLDRIMSIDESEETAKPQEAPKPPVQAQTEVLLLDRIIDAFGTETQGTETQETKAQEPETQEPKAQEPETPEPKAQEPETQEAPVQMDDCLPPIVDESLNISIPCVGIQGKQQAIQLLFAGDATEANFIWHSEGFNDSNCKWKIENCATTTKNMDLTLPNVELDGLPHIALLKFAGNQPQSWTYKKHFENNPEEQNGFSYNHGMLAEAKITPDEAINTIVESTTNSKKLLAIYMVGSDLEGRYKLGSKDLKELIRGYNALTNKDNLQIVIAFGGAKNWPGMRYATIDQILADSEDDKFGDEEGSNAYLYHESRAVMGDKSALTHFLTFLQDNYSNTNPQFLVFWNHGNGCFICGVDVARQIIGKIVEVGQQVIKLA